jgi:hypothetical protein
MGVGAGKGYSNTKNEKNENIFRVFPQNRLLIVRSGFWHEKVATFLCHEFAARKIFIALN